jgi:hypothetical protein
MVGILAVVCAAGLHAGTASANLNLNETAAALALPIITDTSENNCETQECIQRNGRDTVTYMTVTNASSEGLTLAINVIDGDSNKYGNKGSYHHWSASSFSCYVTGRETTLFKFTPDGYGRSKVEFECSTQGANETFPPQALSIPRTEYFNHSTGIMFIAIEQNGVTVSKNVLFGDWVTVDYAAGSAYSAEAIAFQGKDPFSQNGDRVYKFDNKEYAAFPALLATNFLAPNRGIKAELVLFTLDGTTGQSPVPVDLHYNFYNDDEVKRDGDYAFDCFAIVDLAWVDSRFEEYRLQSPAGHLELEPRDVTNGNAAHDRLFGDNNGVRNSPFHGWIVQTIRAGGRVGQDTMDPNGKPMPVSSTGQWARTLAQSVTSHVPAGADVVALKAN